MSLKAKLEAVIYAAEEPVTLAQLSVLFAGEALKWKAEREAERAPELPMAAEPGEELLDLVLDAPARLGTEEDAARATAFLAEFTEQGQSVASAETGSEDSPADSETKAAAAVNAEEAELEARRQERRREREARETLRAILDELMAEYAADGRGLEIREIAGGYRMGTKPEMHDAVRAFVKSLKPAMKLSLPALETLAVIAYKQPVTAPEVAEIRGVDSAGVLGSLMSRKLIATAGRKQVIGRPMLYKTTKEFLLRFGLKDVSELPSMEEFEKMAAQELSEDVVDEGAAQTGDLFAESESATVPAAGGAETEPEPEAVATEQDLNEQGMKADSHAEQQDAEEIEVQS